VRLLGSRRWRDGAERATKLVAKAELPVRLFEAAGVGRTRGVGKLGSPLRAWARPRDTGGGKPELDLAAGGRSLASALALRTEAGASGGEGCGGRRERSRGERRGGARWTRRAEGRPRGGRREIPCQASSDAMSVWGKKKLVRGARMRMEEEEWAPYNRK
jgi:hypothetical protein